jgi:OFA family oxalate/formate antiporter-like MFS transporter
LAQVLERVNSLRKGRGIFYGWWLSGIAALVMVIGTVPLFQGMTAWFVVLEQSFGWSRAQLSIAFSLTRVEGSIMGPISGFLIDKLGPRRMVLIGLLVLGAGFLLLSRVQNLWQFYLAFVVMSSGAGLGTWLPMMTVLNNWFQRRRSTAMAVAMAGFSIGGVLLVPVLAWAIDPDVVSRPGWRATALGIGVVTIALAFPLSRLVRNRPEDYGEHPDGQKSATAVSNSGSSQNPAMDDSGYTWQEALRTRSFWLITWGHACSSIVIVTMMVHLGPMLTDRGFSLQTVGWVLSTYTAVSAAFTVVGGYIGDRIPVRIALFVFSVLQSVAVVVLLLAHTAALAFIFAVLLGIGFGGRNPLTTSIRGVYFGRKAFASITGISMIPMNVLLLAAPLFAGIMFDLQGSYTVPFIAVAAVSFLGSGLFLLLGEPDPLPSGKNRVD